MLSLLDKVGWAIIGDFQKWSVSSYVYETIYGHKKVCHKKVCLEQNILLVPLYGIRSFHAPFHYFSQCFYIRVIPNKASNVVFYSCTYTKSNNNIFQEYFLMCLLGGEEEDKIVTCYQSPSHGQLWQ